jgi:hypothetical protein
MTFGGPRPSLARMGTARHEAGHAIAAILLSLPITAVSIKRSGKLHGAVYGPCPLDGLDCRELPSYGVMAAERMLVMNLAGYCSELFITRDREAARRHARSDLRQARTLVAILAHHSLDKRTHLDRAFQRLAVLVNVAEHMLALLAVALMENETLDYGQIMTVLEGQDLADGRRHLAARW